MTLGLLQNWDLQTRSGHSLEVKAGQNLTSTAAGYLFFYTIMLENSYEDVFNITYQVPLKITSLIIFGKAILVQYRTFEKH